MARYEHLPIYKSAMDLALEMEKTLRNMSRYDKYGIGTELRKRSLAILSFVVRANSTDKKKEVLEEIRITIEELKQLLFLGKETKALPSFSIFKKLVEQAEAVAKQNEGGSQIRSKPESPYFPGDCESPYNWNYLKQRRK